MSEEKRPVGRPPIIFGEKEWDQIEKLCALHCRAEEIAGMMNCSVDTLENKIKETHNINFSEYFAQKSANGKMSLRRKQYQVAMEGNVTQLIWLGKNWLGQKDKIEHSGDELAPLVLNYKLDKDE